METGSGHLSILRINVVQYQNTRWTKLSKESALHNAIKVDTVNSQVLMIIGLAEMNTLHMILKSPYKIVLIVQLRICYSCCVLFFEFRP